MSIESIVTVLIGVFIMFTGYLVLKKKALFLINLVLWNGVTGDKDFLSRLFGTILLVAGFVVILLPFLLALL